MGWFGKKDEVLDLTMLQKKGLLPKESEAEVDADGLLDFSSSDSSSAGSSTESSRDGASALGFLGNLAGAGASPPSGLPSPEPPT